MRCCRPFLGLILTLVACASEGPHVPPVPRRPVRVERVRPGESSGTLRYSANIRPREELGLAFKQGGYVDSIAMRAGQDGSQREIQQGDAVTAGEVLARLRSRDAETAVARAHAQRAEAAAGHEKARLDFERALRLHAEASLTGHDLDALRAALGSAAARVDGASAALEAATISLTESALRTSKTGIIVARNIEVGSLATPGMVAFVVADLSEVRVVFGVPGPVMNHLALGDALVVTSESLAAEVLGTVTAIAPAADPRSRVFEVELTLENPGLTLKSGLVASVEVGRRPAGSERPVVPLSAVVRAPGRPDGYAVFVVAGDGENALAEARDVELGPILGNRIAILRGLELGEPVVTTGATLLINREPVRVLP